MIIVIRFHDTGKIREINVMKLAETLGTNPFEILSYYNERCDYAKIIKKYNKSNKKVV